MLIPWLAILAAVAAQESYKPFWTPVDPQPDATSTESSTTQASAPDTATSTPGEIGWLTPYTTSDFGVAPSSSVAVTPSGGSTTSGAVVGGTGAGTSATSATSAGTSGTGATGTGATGTGSTGTGTNGTDTSGSNTNGTDANSTDLNFGPVQFAGYDNYVLRDNVTAAQIVISQATSNGPARFITAFPNGNTGALVYFLPYSNGTQGNNTIGASLQPDTMSSVSTDNAQTGVSGQLSLSGDAQFGVTLLGSVRTLRDYVESRGKVMHSVFNYTLGAYSNSSVELVRTWLNGSTVQYLRFEAVENSQFEVHQAVNMAARQEPAASVTPASDGPSDASAPAPSTSAADTGAAPTASAAGNGSASNPASPTPSQSGSATAPSASPSADAGKPPPIIRITRPDANKNATIKFTSTFNYTGTTPETPFVPLEGLGAQTLFVAPGSGHGITNSTAGNNATSMTNSTGNSSSSPLDDVLTAIQGSNITQQTAFLSYESQFLAGGWRFLTYFGRDTLIALRLLLPVLSPEATEAILAAVIQRTNATSGQLCHEETVGDYASFLNIQNGQADKGNTPLYVYTMVDTDFLLLPVLADYAEASPQRAKSFMGRNSTLVNGSFAQLLQANIDNVLSLAGPFGSAPEAKNLVGLRSYPVGNWRDSAAGLGGGMYAFDVNCALVPAALDAISRLAKLNLVASNYTNSSSTLAQAWNANACDLFKVSISPDAASSALGSYVSTANLSASLLYGAGSLNGSTAGGWNESEQLIGGGSGNDTSTNTTVANLAAEAASSTSNSTETGPDSNSTFYALSLSTNYTPIPVLHSDLSFVLSYANPSSDILWATVQALQSYPRGLLTNAGMVVANAAYDPNATRAATFANTAYHGAVAWSWQMGMMAQGLSRQLGRCGLSPETQLANRTGNSTRPEWCSDQSLTDALQQAQDRLWASIRGSTSVLWTEVWSPVWSGNGADNGTDANSADANSTKANTTSNRFSIGDLGAISPEGTEGDAIQLWSYGFLALVDPENGPVAAGGNLSAVPVTDSGAKSAAVRVLPSLALVFALVAGCGLLL